MGGGGRRSAVCSEFGAGGDGESGGAGTFLILPIFLPPAAFY